MLNIDQFLEKMKSSLQYVCFCEASRSISCEMDFFTFRIERSVVSMCFFGFGKSIFLISNRAQQFFITTNYCAYGGDETSTMMGGLRRLDRNKGINFWEVDDFGSSSYYIGTV